MAKDLRELFKNDSTQATDKMPEGHQARFLDKLDDALPQHVKPKFNWIRLVASVVVLLGLGYGTFTYVNNGDATPVVVDNDDPKTEIKTQTLGDFSPELKKIEDYYVANINLELSKLKLTPENKELFDGYMLQLEKLNEEYKNLSKEITENGLDELTVNASINNLKFRLNLMYRLKEQLSKLNSLEPTQG